MFLNHPVGHNRGLITSFIFSELDKIETNVWYRKNVGKINFKIKLTCITTSKKI